HPLTLEEDMNEALIPTRALLDELCQSVRRFLPRHELISIDNAHAGMREAQANTEICVFCQAMLIPATQLLHQFPPHEDGIAAQRRHADACKKVHRRFEPEKIL